MVQDDENLTREQYEDQMKKIKEAHAEDEGWSKRFTFVDLFSLWAIYVCVCGAHIHFESL